jgi:soluble lytic murein transglycosylase-like protein
MRIVRNKLASVLLVFVVLMSMLAPACTSSRGDIPTMEQREKQRNEYNEKALTDWVMSRSSRISRETARFIVKEAMKTTKPLLTLAIISVESEFTPTAMSSKGAIGLGQIMWKYHGKALVKAGIVKEDRDLFDISPNIRATDLIINMYLQQNQNDVLKAIERYLGGSDGIYLKKILINVSNLYVLTR